MHIRLKYNTENDKIKKILNENYITVEVLENDKAIKFMNRQIILVSFVFKNKLTCQSFYKHEDKTWYPFDGIKADIDEDGDFYQFFDTKNFKDNFMLEELTLVSYILGGGIWTDETNEHSVKFDLKSRIQQFELSEYPIRFEDSILVNHFINYSISDNYSIYDNRKSAFDGVHKAENWTQMEYVPIKKSLCKDLDEALYKNKIKTPLESSGYMCNIL
jgi:hypothetical protein